MNANPPAKFIPLSPQRHIYNPARRAFTLTELLVLLATSAILAMLLLPVLAGTQSGSTKAFQCLNNMRQMALAWTLYSEDNHDRLAINSDPHVYDSSFFPHNSSNPSWVIGTMDWTVGFYNTNANYLTNDQYSLLGNYLGRSASVFACPATATYVSPVQRTVGWSARARSVAMNAAVGNGDKYEEPNNPFGYASWYVAKKATDFHAPGPSDVWVFTDEHPDSIDDGLLYAANYPVTTFTELPGSQHGGACGMAFADGHAIIHKWSAPVVVVPVIYVNGPPLRQLVPCSISDPDMLWLTQHTPQN